MFLFLVVFGVLIGGCNLFADGFTDIIGTSPSRYHRPQTQLENAGFELGRAYWKDIASEMIGARVSADSVEAYEGQRALKIDLTKAQRLSRDGAFLLASPWLTLPAGGNFSFSIYIKCNQRQVKAVLSVFNATSNEGMRSGTQPIKPVTKQFLCNERWNRVVVEGRLPAAEKNNYRFAVKFTAPAVYWLDKVELLHNGQSCILAPLIEAALQPLSTSSPLSKAPGVAPALLRVVNHTQRQRRLHFVARQTAVLNRFERTLEERITLAPTAAEVKRMEFEVPFAGIYHIAWQVLDEESTVIQSGRLRLAARNPDLPQAPGGEPVWGMHCSGNNLEFTLPILRDAGIRFLRNVANLHWNLVEPKPDQWQWPDSLLGYLRSQGFTVLGKLVFTPDWAVNPTKAKGWPIQNKMPMSITAYRQYVRNVVSHYAQQIDHWEIWNEPNLPRYLDATPQDYAALLAAATAEIKAAQPQAQVAGYALAKFFDPATLDFLQAVINSQPALRPEAASFHPYKNVAPEAAGLMEKINQFRSLFKERQGYEPELWLTELGYQGQDSVNTAIALYLPLRERLLNELTQAAYLVRAACLSKMAGVKYFFVYALDSERINRGPDIYGLLDESWVASPKPALLAYVTLATLLGDAKFKKRLDVGDPEIYLLQYQRHDGKSVDILWTTKGEKHVTLTKPPWLASEKYDLFGNRLDCQTATTVVAGPAPVYFIH